MEEKVVLAFKPSRVSELKLYFWCAVGIAAGIALITLIPGLPFWAYSIPFVLALLFLLRAYIRIVSTRYQLTTQRFFMRSGFIAQNEEEIELYRIQDVKLNQNVLQRILGVGNVTIISADKTSPVLCLRGIRNPNSIKETLRDAYRQAREKEGVRHTEFTA